MAVFDQDTLKIILQSGAYGSGMLFFGYGAWVLTKARNNAQNSNVRWFLCIGAVVFLALAGLDFAKSQLSTKGADRRVFLAFSPTFADMSLPDPTVTYLGQSVPVQGPVTVQSSDSSIQISFQRTVQALNQLRAEKRIAEAAYGANVAMQVPKPLAAEIAEVASSSAPCDARDAACGWAALSNGDLDAAKAKFERTIATTSTATPAPSTDVAEALHGLGEIYVGRGDIAKASEVLSRASAMGNDAAEKRLQNISTIVTALPAPAPAPKP